MVFGIVTVCLGNICRSPAAEILLARSLDETVEVSSAGVGGLPQWPVSEPMARILGADRSGVQAFRSHRITEADIRDADLILAMANDHKRAILEIAPLAMRRTFTLGEFARLAQAVPPQIATNWHQPNLADSERLAQLLELARDLRRHVPARATGDDVVDPYRYPDEIYQLSYQQLSGHIDKILRVLHGTEPTARIDY